MVLGPSSTTLSTTLMELAGTEPGEYDSLLVSGSLKVGGELEVAILDDFIPMIDDAFQIFEATDFLGTFSSVVLPDLLGDLDWNSSHLYTSGRLFVIPEATTLTLLAVGALLACYRRRRH